MNTSHTSVRRVRRFEDEGRFYIGGIQNENERRTRLLCFRNAVTGAVGASRRFSRQEAYRKSKRIPLTALGGGFPEINKPDPGQHQ